MDKPEETPVGADPTIDDAARAVNFYQITPSAPPAPRPARKRKPWWVRIPLMALGTALAALLMLMFIENSLIYYPFKSAARGGWDPPTPRGENVAFVSADGTQLTGWYMPHPEPQAVVLFACGNGGNMTYWRDYFLDLQEQCRVTVMGFDYRGYGRSHGSPNEQGVLADARAARKWLAAKAGIAEDQIVLLGRSIGGGVMVDLAGDGARALVVESTFTSLPDVAARVYPFLPVRYVMRTRFDSMSKIKNYRSPLFVSHGTGDRLIPFAMGQQLYDAAGSTQKKFYIVEGGDHNDPQPPGYYTTLAEFFAQLP
jgi:fermentation-respiration switch protein FrsA (DUF1100 family)